MNKMFIKCLLLIVIIECLVFVSIESKTSEDDIQTCSKDDELCLSAETKESTDKTSSDTSAKKQSKSATGAGKSKKSKDSNDVVANCPLCSFTRPLIKNLMDWIKELLTDPMLIMVFEMFRNKIWDLGHMTKDIFGFRLF